MSVKWTPAQLCAIESRGCDLLVSAAAGSGKTAVLTERLIRRLCDRDEPADISRMLIVTFTKAAATELREKIGRVITRACEENPGNKALARQKRKLPGAIISTIDSFCFRVIKENFSALGVGPGVRIADDSEVVPVALAVMDRIIERRYGTAERGDETDTDFRRLCDLLVSDRDDGLSARLYGFYVKVQKFIGREGIFLSSADELERASSCDYFSTPWGAESRRTLISSLDFYRAEYENALGLVRQEEELQKKFESSMLADLELMDGLRLAAGKGYSEAAGLLSSFSAVRIGRNAVDSPVLGRIQSVREDFSSYRKNTLAPLFAPSREAISRSMTESACIMRTLYSVLAEFSAEFSAEKRRRGFIDYADAESLTLDLLVRDGEPTELAARISQDFDEIYIDEYQDINPVQDAIFSALARGNRFMVGDIKQSIYRFRGAEPDIFSDYRSRFPKLSDPKDAGSDGRTVFLSDNFRCDRSVTGFVNDIFRRIMTPQSGSMLTYSEDDELVCSKSEEGRLRPEAKTRVAVLIPEPVTEDDRAGDADASTDGSSSADGDIPEPSTADAEAEYVAAESERLIRSGQYAPSDIRILTRTGAGKESFVRAFRRHGIPLASERAVPFFSRPHILLALALLRTIDNPRRSIPLASVLLSPIGGFSPEELTKVRRGISPDGSYREDARKRASGSLYSSLLAYTERWSCPKGTRFLALLSDMRKRAASTPSDELIWQLFSETALLSCGNPGDGFTREVMHRDLLRLYEFARERESRGFRGLSQLLRSIDELCETNDSFTFDSGESDCDAVQIMTMHKSKGLEFPVCFVCGCARSIDAMSRLDTNDVLLIDKRLGAVTRLRDKTGFVRYTTPMFDAVADKSCAELYDEELRILYVALTRARERLYVTAATKEPEKLLAEAEREARYPSEHTHFSNASYIKWILSAMLGDDDRRPRDGENCYSSADGGRALLAETESATAELLCYRGNGSIPVIPAPRSDQSGSGEDTVCKAYGTAGKNAPYCSEQSKSIAGDKNTADGTASELCSAEKSTPPVGRACTPDELRRRILYSYPRAYAARLPAKLSVTSLHPGMLDEDVFLSPEQANRYAMGIPEPCPDSDGPGWNPAMHRPSFASDKAEDASGAEKGTALHVFLQFCDWERVISDGIGAELSRLTELGFMTAEMAKLVDIKKAGHFFSSGLFQDVKNAKRIWRELRFNILLPASDYTESAERRALMADEQLLIQGIIDCMYLSADGKLRLLDYKTDRLPTDGREAAVLLASRYGEQMRTYMRAAEQITGLPLDRCVIFALSSGQEIILRENGRDTPLAAVSEE